MKNIFVLIAASCIAAVFIHAIDIPLKKKYPDDAEQKAIAYKKKYAFSCTPDIAAINFNDSANIVPLLQGWGKYRMPVTVSNDSAFVYFQQGINMYYGFHIIEALASFNKAVNFDAHFAMGYWGKALAYGPNINDLGYAASPEALVAVKKADSLKGNCTPVEKALINAMQVRYSADSTQTRDHLNQLYADAMKKVHADFSESGDAAALYADALMVQHPWDLYDRLYKPKPWTPAIVHILENLVQQFPDHPGASHYYIHAIEGSEHPEKGLKVANRLGDMMPGVAHLVHMPSHIFIRSGYYNKGVVVNDSAVKSYYSYLAQYAPVADNAPLYLMHNLHMAATCANMDCRYADALGLSNQTRNSFDTAWLDAGGYLGVYIQYAYITPYLTQIRFGKWDDILQVPAIPASRVYANIMWHYGRGLAFARKHQFDNAAIELQGMRDSMGAAQLKESPPAFNPGIASVNVAEKILQGVIAEEKNNLAEAETFLRKGVDNETGMLYNEPRDWPHPARQYLASVLLKQKKYAESEKMYKEDLVINPNNAWSLTGLKEALIAQGKTKEAMKTQDLAKQALIRSDTRIVKSVF